MGIKVAYIGLLAVLRRLYANCRRALRAHWQVSGQLDSGAKSLRCLHLWFFTALKIILECPFPPGLSPSGSKPCGG